MIHVDIIVGSDTTEKDELTRNKILIQKANDELPVNWRWVTRLMFQMVEEVTSAVAENEPAPAKAFIRTTDPNARQINSKSEDSEEE